MIFITGGAYQGKLTFAAEKYALTAQQLSDCAVGSTDFSAKCLFHLESFTLRCAREGLDPVAHFEENRAAWQDSILICRDISCGVVPMDADMRQWRQVNGKLCQYLARQADAVYRIFCGMEQRIK